MRAADFPVISQGLTQCLIPLAANDSSSNIVMQPLGMGIQNAPLQKP
eukprot:CAMPEP_0114602272 /NCGR_PEP_ID=MMETSP0125-20121206/24870_1 /TAXON_ID=485358 ORGANISM="Aristerostoma sp., Strain ATCC 50986" /NCGR_SAMPLE_ID=MMETSP0125 /ASSEMBLY_ACC=CAM_ASM_000245 /LENGTH=46 /DNA_ID= /DNA_START= /DNA_END= /DNA_ORIENTATION=